MGPAAAAALGVVDPGLDVAARLLGAELLLPADHLQALGLLAVLLQVEVLGQEEPTLQPPVGDLAWACAARASATTPASSTTGRTPASPSTRRWSSASCGSSATTWL